MPHTKTEQSSTLNSLIKQSSLVDDIKSFQSPTKFGKDGFSDELENMMEPIENDDFFLISVAKVKS
jgi:hypothetical protein